MQGINELLNAKILVIDDEEDSFELISQILTPKGCDLLYADSGTAGFIKAKQEAPDLIILDITMPLMDGFETQRLLKEYGPTSNIPVLFLSGATILEYKPMAIKQGAVGYMQKPIDENELLAHVNKLFQAAKNQSGF